LDGVANLTMGAGSVLRFSRTDINMPTFTADISGTATSRIEQNGTGKTSIFGGVSVLGVGGFLGDVVVNAGEMEAALASGFEYARSITINAGTFTALEGALGYGAGGVGPDVTINGGLMRLLDAGVATNNGIGDLVLNGGIVSSGAGQAGLNSLLVTGAISAMNDATISAENVGLNFGGTSTATPVEITVAATKTLTFSGSIANDGSNFADSSFDKKGTGTLILSGNNSGMTGASSVTAGVLDVRHVNALGDGSTTGNNLTTGSFTVGASAFIVSNQTNFASPGAVAGNITVSTGGSIGVAAPGSAVIGHLSVTNLTMQSGSNIEFKIWDRAGGAGIGYDKLDLGTLDLAGVTTSSRVTIKLISMSAANAFGNSTLVKPVDQAGFQSFDIGTYDNTPGVNVSDLFRFDASQFTYANGSASDAGLWMVNFNDGTGAITLTAVPEPSTYGFGLGALALAAAALRRRRQTKKA
jgi:MYXO-CTERM domain-containing protein